MISVRMPDGTVQNYRPENTTNADGFTQVVFDVQNVQPNQVVEVQVKANVVNGPDGSASTWFRIWW